MRRSWLRADAEAEEGPCYSGLLALEFDFFAVFGAGVDHCDVGKYLCQESQVVDEVLEGIF